jgi:hypothetical protein
VTHARYWQQIVRSFSKVIVPLGVEGLDAVHPPVVVDLYAFTLVPGEDPEHTPCVAVVSFASALPVHCG